MSRHSHVWAQTCMGTNVCEHKRVLAKTCLGTNVCMNSHGVTVVWAQSCLGGKRGGTVDTLFTFTFLEEAKRKVNTLVY